LDELGIAYTLHTYAVGREHLAAAEVVELVPLSRVTPLTGYVRGGTTALAAKKAFPVYLDEAAMKGAHIVVSAGQKGLQIRVAPADYVRATSAKVALIARKSTSPPDS
jgi:Cys-tRNA(Pro)/Cys-tRNA(Cys) deacylase